MKFMKKAISKSLLMTALITGLCVGGAQGAFAGETLQEFTLDPMIVTATRTEKNLLKVPASATVITAKEIQEKNIKDFKDIFKGQSGILVSQTEDAYSGIQMRGFNSENILVLYDGQPMNNAWNGEASLTSIPVENIERIEIVRGAASSLYGGRAVGGVINIIPKDIGNNKLAGSAVISYGSNDTWKKALDVQGKVNDKWSFGIGYEHRKTDGYSGFRKTVDPTDPTKVDESKINGTVNLEKLGEGNAFSTYDNRYIVGGRGERVSENESYNFALKYNFDKDKSLKYTYTHSDYKYRYSNPFSYIKDVNGKELFKGTFKTQFNEYVTIAPKDFYSSDSERETDIHTLNYKDSKNLWNVNLGLQEVDEYSYNASNSNITENGRTGSGSLDCQPNKNYNLDIQKTWDNIGNHTITIGANLKEEQMDKFGYSLKQWNNPNSITTKNSTYSGGKTELMAAFVQDEFAISEPVTLYLGARIDRYKKHDGYNQTDGKIEDTSYTEFSPKVAIEYAPKDDMSYYLSYGHSFNTPTLYKLYRYSSSSTGDILANPDLEPETSDTFEIGFKKKFDKTLMTVSAFQVDTKDIIYYDKNVKIGNDIFKMYRNADEASKCGIEFDVRHEFDDSLNGYFNYTWQNGEITTDNQTNNDYDIPKHIVHMGLDYTVGKLNAVLDAQYVSRCQAPTAATGVFGAMDPYFTMNTYFNYKITPQATLQFGIENLLDREYYNENLAEGRTYNVSLRYSF